MKMLDLNSIAEKNEGSSSSIKEYNIHVTTANEAIFGLLKEEKEIRLPQDSETLLQFTPQTPDPKTED
jgi:hypothetical protein